MRILMTTDSYLPSINGVVTSVVNLISGLESLGHEVRVVALSSDSKTYTEGNVTYIGSMNGEKIYPGIRVRITPSRKLMHDLIGWKPDIVHSQSEFSTFVIAKKVAVKLNVPLIQTYHTIYEDYTKYFSPSKKLGKALTRRFTKNISNHCNALIAPTKKIDKLLTDYSVSSNIYTVPTGIDLAKFDNIDSEQSSKIREKHNIDKDTTLLISVSRLCVSKSIHEVINGFSKCKDLNAKLMVVGDGPAKNELMELCKKNNVQDKVIFTGMVNPKEVPNYYATADIFVSASTSETQGLTYIEALASGTPLLCKKDECLNDVLQNGFNGYSFVTESEFVKRLTELCNDKSRLQVLTEHAKPSSQKFSIKEFASSIERIYKKEFKQNEIDFSYKHYTILNYKVLNVLSIVLTALLVVFSIYAYNQGWFTSLEALQTLIDSHGVAAPIIFVISQIAQVVFPIIPGGLGCLAGVLLFGPVEGFIYNYLGICIGSLIVFAISKYYGSNLMYNIFPRNLVKRYNKWINKGKRFEKFFFWAIFVPVAPDDFLCYLAGTTSMTWKKYTAIIFTAKIASIAAYSFLLVYAWDFAMSFLT